MIIRRWSPDVRLELDSLQSIPLWVSFQGLPLHLWSRRFIAKLCSTLGQPLYIDKATAAQTRLAFARACVLVFSDEDLPNEVFYRDLDGNTRKVHVHILGSHNDVSIAYLLVMQMELISKLQNKSQRSIDHVKRLRNKASLL